MRTAERARNTAALVAIQPGARRRRMPRQAEPRAIQREYARKLIAEVHALSEALDPVRDALPALVRGVQAERADAGEGARIRELLAAVERATRSRLSTARLDAVARLFAERTSTFQRVQLLRQTRAALGVDVFAIETGLKGLVDGFAVENVGLIKNISTRAFDEIEQLTTRGLASATPHREIAKQIEKRLAIGRDRAKLIARDQIGKLYGQVNHTRQRALGVRQFIWRTVNDERVRDEHEALAGRTFSYSDPPSEGLPGEPVLCRCYAEPVFTEIEEFAKGARAA